MPSITRSTLVGEALRKYPAAQEVFARHGMGCAQCMEAVDETIEDAARMHGLSVTSLLDELNALVGQDHGRLPA